MRVVVALGGNALLERGQAMTAENQRVNVRTAAQALAEISKAGHELIIAHGNGPQVGLLALQSAAYTEVEDYPLDVLGAETVGMIGYMIEQELGNVVPFEQRIATILTQIEVDPKDPAFENPTKPIGPVYDKEIAEKLAKERGWSIAPDGDKFRRVVASPEPKRIFELDVIKMLSKQGVIVICTGGGGVPTMYREDGSLCGVEAVIDKDRAACLLAEGLGADAFLILTDVPSVVEGWGTPEARNISAGSPEAFRAMDFAKGSMGPKIEAAAKFAEATGHLAAIGRLEDAVGMLNRARGTRVGTDVDGIQYYPEGSEVRKSG